jgi:hypothetical protein
LPHCGLYKTGYHKTSKRGVEPKFLQLVATLTYHEETSQKASLKKFGRGFKGGFKGGFAASTPQIKALS